MKSSRTEKRTAILADHAEQPHVKARELGRKHNCHHSTVSKYLREEMEGVVGKPVGRPTAFSSSQVKNVVKKAVAQKSASSVRLASGLNAQGIIVSSKTVNRNLRENGVACGYPKRVPPLKPIHKINRMKWASRFLNSKRSFTGWMFTDSKYLLLRSLSSKRGRKVYYPEGERPTVGTVSHSQGVHFYLGVTPFGATPPVLATGGGRKKPSYRREDGKGFHTGVCGREYREEILPQLIAGGKRLFAPHNKWVGRWVFQQDNAPIHMSQESIERIVELIDGNEGRVEQKWHALSPDLSWIENVWAWAENELDRKRDEINTLPELETEVITFWVGAH